MIKRRWSFVAWSWVIAALATMTASTAMGQPCPKVRPTDPSGGFLHYPDPAVVVFHDASDRIRVWYATEGAHAPAPSPMGNSGAPQNVERVGEVLEEAWQGFTAMGFKAPLSDGDYAPCASNGGDGRLDAYLISFPVGADGSAGTDRCDFGSVRTCSGFMLLENDFSSGGYASFEEAVRVVGPHELFHLVQNAYNADMDAWWSEGTAQWAANHLRPELTDLEAFLPTFFAKPGQSLDLSGGGATNAWLYATAIWPVFLDTRFGPNTMTETFERLAMYSEPALTATHEVLLGKGSSLGETFLEFATFNAATGERSGDGGYPEAATYPMVPVMPLGSDMGTLHKGLLAGLSSSYFFSSETRRMSLEGDPSRVVAAALPLVDGRAQLDAVQRLPADVSGPTIIVVAGQSTSKVDATFRLVAEPFVEPEPEPEPEEDTNFGESEATGCSVGLGAQGAQPVQKILWFFMAFSLVRRRLRRGVRLASGPTKDTEIRTLLRRAC